MFSDNFDASGLSNFTQVDRAGSSNFSVSTAGVTEDAGQVGGNVGTASGSQPGAWLQPTDVYADPDYDFTVTFDARLMSEGSLDDCVFILGNQDDGEYYTIYLHESAQYCELDYYSSSIRATPPTVGSYASTAFADDTWYSITVTWVAATQTLSFNATQHGSATSFAAFSAVLDDAGTNNPSLKSFNYGIQFGFGTHNDGARFDNIVIDGTAGSPPPPVVLPGGSVEIAPDGAYCWFQDERAIWHQGSLYAGYVKSDGHYGVSRYDLATGDTHHMIISTATSMQKDDHNNPSITVLPDNRLLVVYSQHGYQNVFYHRTSTVTNPSLSSHWSSEQSHFAGAGTTYANTYRLKSESNKIYNFHRAIGYDPTLSISTNNGASWGTSFQVINAGNSSQRPYPRYCSNHDDRIDFIYTDAHPNAQPTAIYHMYYKADAFRKTDGTLVKTMANLPIQHGSLVTETGKERGSVVYDYSEAAWGPDDGPDDWIPKGRAWTWDIAYGEDGHPVCVFHVQPFNAPASNRFYYYYARWTGTEWQKRVIATGGGSIGHYTYTGGMTIDPDDPRVVYISSNADDPFDLSDIFNIPVSSGNKFEIYRGFTADGGLTFEWDVVTANSAKDNLRPLVPENHGLTRHVVWFHGDYNSYVNYDCSVLGIFDEPKELLSDWKTAHGISGESVTTDSDKDGLNHLLEYALSGVPTDQSDAPAPVLDGSTYSFQHVAARTDVETVVQFSPDLSTDSWMDVATVRAAGLPNTVVSGFTLQSDNGAPELMSLTINPGSYDEMGYLRVKVNEL